MFNVEMGREHTLVDVSSWPKIPSKNMLAQMIQYNVIGS